MPNFEQRHWLRGLQRLRGLHRLRPVGVVVLASSGVLAGCVEGEGEASRDVPLFEWSGPGAAESGEQSAVGESSGGVGGSSDGEELAAGGNIALGGAAGSAEQPWGT